LILVCANHKCKIGTTNLATAAKGLLRVRAATSDARRVAQALNSSANRPNKWHVDSS
jgi:hypothetical protein